jgi:hypothetical protein
VYADSTAHELKISENGGAYKTVRKRHTGSVIGSTDLTAGTPSNVNVTGLTNVRKITRARFWVTASGADVGANTSTTIGIQFFNRDTFLHGEYLATLTGVGAQALVEDFGSFRFQCQDVKANANNAATSIDIDSTTDYSANDMVVYTDGTKYEFARVTAVTDADTLAVTAIIRTGTPAWSVDEDCARVLELRDITYTDQDATGELHVRFDPLAGDSNCRVHYWLEYEE